MNSASGKPGDDKLRTPNPDCPACQQYKFPIPRANAANSQTPSSAKNTK